MTSKFYKDFDQYSRALMGSRDVDPTYPVIRSIVQREGFDPLWFAFVYVGFYSLETAIKMCRVMPTHLDWDSRQFAEKRATEWKKFGHERRGSARNVQNQIVMFEEVVKLIKFLDGDLAEFNSAWGKIFDNQFSFREVVQTLPNHGGWAAFKLGEIMEKAFETPNFHIPDLGVVGRDPNSNDGPVSGLRWLFGRDNTYDKNWYGIWDRFGVELSKGWGVDIGQVETCLCKWHKFVSGKYYIGHDIHEFHELEPVLGRREYKSIMSEHFSPEIWEDFHGIQKPWKSAYKEKGNILFKNFGNQFPEVDVLDIILQLDND